MAGVAIVFARIVYRCVYKHRVLRDYLEIQWRIKYLGGVFLLLTTQFDPDPSDGSIDCTDRWSLYMTSYLRGMMRCNLIEYRTRVFVRVVSAPNVNLMNWVSELSSFWIASNIAIFLRFSVGCSAIYWISQN